MSAKYHYMKMLRGIVLYGLLIGGSAIFVLPFLWMIGTSFKLEREMASTELTFIPQTPVPAQVSPYFDLRYYPESEDPVYTQNKPRIEAALAKKGIDADLIPTLVPGIYHELTQVLSSKAWEQEPEALDAKIEKRLSDERIAAVRRRIERKLILGSVRVRSIDLQEVNLTDAQPPASLWNVVADSAQLVPESASEAVVHYNFKENPSDALHLSTTAKLPFEADRIHRIQIALTPDDSWHQVYFTIEKNGVQYRGKRPQVLSDSQATVVLLQEWGPDDAADSSKIKLWIPYEEMARGEAFDHGPNQIKISMEIKKSSNWDAWMAKITNNYKKTMVYIPFWRYTATSLFLVILNIIGNIFSCSLAAYAFARLSWPGRNLSFALMMATMMIPPQVTMIPFFLIIKSIGWYNTLAPLWVMSFFGNAFNIFLLRQFMMGIPRDLEDAAKIDGCNFMHIYWHVIMPLIKPTLACIAVFTFLGTWNNFMGPLIFLSDQRLYPLSLGLYAFKVQQGGDFGMMMAGSLLMTMPIILIFFFAQRYFIQGIALTGTKG